MNCVCARPDDKRIPNRAIGSTTRCATNFFAVGSIEYNAPMSTVLEELVQLLSLEPIEENLFRGQSQDLGWGTVFGGQVLGQALSAATQTVDSDRHVHSLHAYFL